MMMRACRPAMRTGLIAACLALPQHQGTAGAERSPKVLNGIDLLLEQKFAPLEGKKVALITNQTGLSADGARTVDLLFASQACKLVAIFSPEHGLRGVAEGEVGSTIDAATGLPVFSLYGESKRPSAEALRGIDALIIDIQDIGARFYTYATSMAYCMEECAKAKISFYVLDRPNPIGGTAVEGPLLDPDKTSFIGYMPLPVRHGMTLGELARYFNAENKIGVDLHVVEMRGWRRRHFFYDTGQLWVNPSPNIRNLVEAILYPGVCLLEATNVSVGRGTAGPFEIVGAPWIEPRRLADALNAAGVSGIRYVPLSFMPNAGKYGGQKCGGVHMILTSPERFNSVLAGLTLVSVLHRLYPDTFEVDKVLRLLGNERALHALKAGQSPAAVLQAGSAEMTRFLERRRRALIYGQAVVPKEGKR